MTSLPNVVLAALCVCVCVCVCVLSGFQGPGLDRVTCEWLTGGLGVLCALPLPVCVPR